MTAQPDDHVRGRRPHASRGSGRRPQAARHVHRVDRQPWRQPPRSTRSWTTPPTRASAGHATRVEVILHADGSVQVDDDGRGIPTDIHAKSGHVRRRAGADPAARGRQVRRLRLQDLRRPARRRRVRGQRAVACASTSPSSGTARFTRCRSSTACPACSTAPGPTARVHAGSPACGSSGRMKRGESTGTSIRYWYDARYFETGAALSTSRRCGPSCATPRSWSPASTYVLREPDRRRRPRRRSTTPTA